MSVSLSGRNAYHHATPPSRFADMKMHKFQGFLPAKCDFVLLQFFSCALAKDFVFGLVKALEIKYQ